MTGPGARIAGRSSTGAGRRLAQPAVTTAIAIAAMAKRTGGFTTTYDNEGRIGATTDLRGKSSSKPRQKGHESYRIEYLLTHAGRACLDDGEALNAALAFFVARQRKHHAPARLEIAQQRCGHVRGTRRHDDRIDGELFAEFRAAISVCKAHVADPERLQVPPRLVDERADALDGIDGLRQ